MITAGIDMGSKTIKVVILQDGRIVAKSIVFAGVGNREAAERAFARALADAHLQMQYVEDVVATGTGRKNAPFAEQDITEVGSDAKAVLRLYPSARTVIDVGAEEGRAIRCNELGKVLDFALNEKCAAGAGAFTEAMSRVLGVDVEDLGNMSLRSKRAAPMNARCVVFAESEAASLLHHKTAKEDIARAVHDAIASRIATLTRKVGFEPDVVLIGGLAHNVGFVDSLERALECKVIVPEDPEYIGAYGAALSAADA